MRRTKNHPRKGKIRQRLLLNCKRRGRRRQCPHKGTRTVLTEEQDMAYRKGKRELFRWIIIKVVNVFPESCVFFRAAQNTAKISEARAADCMQYKRVGCCCRRNNDISLFQYGMQRNQIFDIFYQVL